VACFTHAMRLNGVGKLIPNDRWRPHRTGVEKGEHPLKIRAVAHNGRAQRFNIAAGRSKPFRSRSNPNQSTSGPQRRIASSPNISPNCVEYDVAIGNYASKILNVIIDHPIGTETAHIGMIASARCGDDRGAKYLVS